MSLEYVDSLDTKLFEDRDLGLDHPIVHCRPWLLLVGATHDRVRLPQYKPFLRGRKYNLRYPRRYGRSSNACSTMASSH